MRTGGSSECTMNRPESTSELGEEGPTPEQSDPMADRLVDDLCYAIAVALRQVLDVEETSDDAED